MPAPVIDFARKIKDILKHVRPLLAEAKSPIRHYRRTIADIWGALDHIEMAFGLTTLSPTVVERHLDLLYGMALVNLVETFERFLKEAAAECVDCIAAFILDDRFNSFDVHGSVLASHFGAGTLGKSLCESSTWLDCKEINERFKRLLADPFNASGQQFYLFPKQGQQPLDEQWRLEVMTLVWQLRHTGVHNIGVITRSDAVKLTIMAKEPVASEVVIAPMRADLGFLKQFLDDTAEVCNQRIGIRLAELLTTIHTQAPSLFTPSEMANRVTELFQFVLPIAGVAGILPPP